MDNVKIWHPLPHAPQIVGGDGGSVINVFYKNSFVIIPFVCTLAMIGYTYCRLLLQERIRVNQSHSENTTFRTISITANRQNQPP